MGILVLVKVLVVIVVIMIVLPWIVVVLHNIEARQFLLRRSLVS